jgi:hypothetical protein
MEMHPIPVELFRLKSATTDEFVAALPGGTSLISGSFTASTIEFDGDITVTGTSALNGLVTLGVDAATNTAGSIKFWSAGANDFYTTFTAGTQTANTTYTLPTAMPPYDSRALMCSTTGFLSWGTDFAGNAITTTGLGTFGSLQVNSISIDAYNINSSIEMSIAATNDLLLASTTGYIHLFNNTYLSDNVFLYFGTSQDASVYYDAANLRINPKVVGSGVCIVDGTVNVRNTDTVGPITIHSMASYFSYTTSTNWSCALIGLGYLRLTNNIASTGILGCQRGTLNLETNYNLTSTQNLSVAIFGSILNYGGVVASGNIDALAGWSMRYGDNGTGFSGNIATLYGILVDSLGTQTHRLSFTTGYGINIGEIDGNSLSTNCTGLYIGNVHDATTINRAIWTNGGLHYLDDAAYIGDVSGGNYTEIETDGTLKFNGAATVWNDANVGVTMLALPAASQPDEDEFVDEVGSDTGITTFAFAAGEKVSGSIELPHDYKEGSNIYFHVHWQGIAAPAGGTDNVKWQLKYTVAQSEETLDAATTIVKETAITVQYDFKLSEFAAIVGTNFNIGDQFLFTLERIAASADEYAGDALVATVGLHYECDTVGSRQMTTK